MIEIKILNYLLNIDNYVKYRHKLSIKEPPHVKKLYEILDKAMSKYNRTLSLEEFMSFICLYDETLLTYIESHDVGEDILLDLIKKSVERTWAYNNALLCVDVSEGNKDISEVIDHFSELEDEKEATSVEAFVTDDLEEIYENTIQRHGLRWRLNSLNKSVGSLRKGNFVVVFARPETGKTTFLGSEVTCMAEQTEQPILWINNEQEGTQVKLRCYQSALGLTLDELYQDRHKHHVDYIERTRGNIKIYDSADTHKKQIEGFCKEFKPSLVVIDQIDKVKGFNDDREDLRLGAIYIWARELAKRYCPVIGICQAAASGEGKRWLDMGDMSNSKTSKSAEADVIIGVGKVHEQGMENIRYLNIIKNKLVGDEDSDPSMRHARIETLIVPEIARYKDLD